MYIKILRDKLKHRINLVRAKTNLDRFHKLHKQNAFKDIRSIEEHNGQKLTTLMRKKADEYAVEVFGDIRYAPWLYFYSAFSGKFKEGWIPANFYTRYVLPDKGLQGIAITKTFSKIVLKTEALPDIAYHINGLLFDKDFTPINLNELHRIIGKGSRVILKNNQSTRGTGVTQLSVDRLDELTIHSFGDCVFQYVVRQHPFFDNMVVGPLTAIRVVTVRNPKGRIEYRGAYLKLGRQGKELYKTVEAIAVPVINDKGLLSQFGYYVSYKRLTRHPDTGYSFKNVHIPKFQEAVAFCIKLHSSIPHFPIIGWDVAIDCEENIKLLEWNAGMPHPAIRTLEGTIGPCFTGLNWELLKKD